MKEKENGKWKWIFYLYVLIIIRLIVFKYPYSELRTIMEGWRSDVVWEGLDESAMPTLEGIVQVNDFSVLVSRTEKLTYAREHLNEMFGKKFPKNFRKEHINYHKDSPEELAVLNYTSGTTSYSKGVMLPYRALWSNMQFAFGVLKLHPGDKLVSMLPMAHMYGLAFEFLYEFCAGCHVYFLTRMPSPKIILQAFAEVKPQLVIAVPLIIEKIIKKNVLPKLETPAMKILLKVPIVSDKIKATVREQIMNAFGGNFYEVVVGGAAFNQEVEQFLRSINFPYTVGYGMTECAPIITYEDWKKFKAGSCGKQVPRMEVKILSPDPQNIVGEIVCKGDNVMLGYYKNPEATAEVIDKDGWMHTGDLGIMDTSTSFVNEFKLGIYAYDAILSGRTENTTIEAGLGITSDVKAELAGGLSYVPYEAIKELGNVKDVTDDDGIRVNGGNENYYPRNILWNKYLNHHNPFVITNNVRNPNDLNGETTSVDVTITEAAAGKTGFRYVPGVCATTNQKVLTDEAGRVLIGVRSEHGIHLMVMQKSIYDFDATANGISLNDYYTTYTPADAQYPNVNVPTYVTYLSNASQSVLNERATKVKDTIKSFDSTYGYRLYNYFLDQYKLTFNGDLGEEISNYIAAQQEYNIWTNEKDMAKAWRTYLELLDVQEANRTTERLIPEVCAIKFRDAYNSKGELYDADFKEGGQCYYAN